MGMRKFHEQKSRDGMLAGILTIVLFSMLIGMVIGLLVSWRQPMNRVARCFGLPESRTLRHKVLP